MGQPLPAAVRVTRPDEPPRTRPPVLAARQIDHICAPERRASKEDGGRAERRISRDVRDQQSLRNATGVHSPDEPNAE